MELTPSDTKLHLAQRKGTGCRGGKCQVPAQSPPGGFTEPFPPHPPAHHQHQALASSQYIHQPGPIKEGGGRGEAASRGANVLSDRCGGECSVSSAELFLCNTVISDPWDPLGMPRTIG